MFRNRTNSQKPDNELLESFRASYPHVGATSRSLSVSGTTAPQHTTSLLTDALDVAQLQTRPFGDGDDVKDLDPTPKGSSEQWRFTPSMLDPNSFAFTNFANQPPGYYTPTPGGTNTLYHPQAGDLHTPSGFTMGLGTPLSLPTSEDAIHAQQPAASMPIHGTYPTVAHHSFQNPTPFAMHHQQTGFAPHQFHHPGATFHPLQSQNDPHQVVDSAVDVEMQEQSPTGLGFATQAQAFETAMRPPLTHQAQENFRFYSTLNAPTAMIKHADEIPVTYLNKGQAYSISVVDTTPSPNLAAPPRYRTFVRISFEDEQQRQRPAACWQLWKEGRGTNEAHHRGGRLQAVEFVDPAQAGGAEIPGRPRIELESASFDGFCVTWSPPPNAPFECGIAVRFNFLSTDFSHSKGVKGIPVRLCAKTEQLVDQSPTAAQITKSEICYCKVKLFRDHGAERKLSNDIQHVKKTIDKLRQQIAQIESGMKDFGKRKRSGSISKSSGSSSNPNPNPNNRPGKVPKHKRTWSMSSTSDTGGRPAAEEDLHMKLQTLTDMFTSTRPASVLFLRGDDLDDPDLHPVKLSGEPLDLTRTSTADSSMWEQQSTQGARTSSIVSPTPSNQSIQSGDDGRRGSSFQRPTPFNPSSRTSSSEWRNTQQTATGDITGVQLGQNFSPLTGPHRIQKRSSDQGQLPGWIEAVGVDPHYQPPPERAVKPVACFYVQLSRAGRQPEDNYYRAVYLMQRKLKDFVNGIAMKANIEPTQVIRTLRINQKGLRILVDEELVQEIPEGQDMIAEIQDLRPQEPMKREWDSGPTDIQVDGDIGFIENTNSEGYELRLHF